MSRVQSLAIGLINPHFTPVIIMLINLGMFLLLVRGITNADIKVICSLIFWLVNAVALSVGAILRLMESLKENKNGYKK